MWRPWITWTPHASLLRACYSKFPGDWPPSHFCMQVCGLPGWHRQTDHSPCYSEALFSEVALSCSSCELRLPLVDVPCHRPDSHLGDAGPPDLWNLLVSESLAVGCITLRWWTGQGVSCTCLSDGHHRLPSSELCSLCLWLPKVPARLGPSMPCLHPAHADPSTSVLRHI
jgi:hypothetical protein